MHNIILYQGTSFQLGTIVMLLMAGSQYKQSRALGNLYFLVQYKLIKNDIACR